MRTLFVGAGATGGYFGGRLASGGKDVTFLVRPGRAATLRERGLRIKSPGSETVVQPRLITADRVDGPYDLVVIAVKSYFLEQAMIDLAPAVGPSTVVVPLLNGMRHVEELVGAFGPERAWGGLCFVQATLNADGDVVRTGAMHRLGYGPLDGSADPRLPAVTEALTGEEFDSHPSRTIVQDMWEKWQYLASMAAITTLMGGTTAEVNAVPGGAEFSARVVAEALAVLTAAGHDPRPGALTLLHDDTHTTTRQVSTSMYRDMVAGLPVEAEAVLGDFVNEAGKAGVPAPMFAAAYAHMRVYAARRSAG
ncbi:ketopantoate reductase family protein [Actinoplanes sp. TBRC 11911]|uniref:ketopantoate reductase family protein n=1 Tax=Actinoplanes sp. TBRC 11911 TaxID=2729386 RepID=UPI00145CAB92|nr:ketopantoate reductase family protein [Actinoplanes sp. TBRC 11911]NMO51327.1 ketopantoate reductase family protein [Actinoplanes sp. TBRC 11911]